MTNWENPEGFCMFTEGGDNLVREAMLRVYSDLTTGKAKVSKASAVMYQALDDIARKYPGAREATDTAVRERCANYLEYHLKKFFGTDIYISIYG